MLVIEILSVKQPEVLAQLAGMWRPFDYEHNPQKVVYDHDCDFQYYQKLMQEVPKP